MANERGKSSVPASVTAPFTAVKDATQSRTKEGRKPWYVEAPVASIIAPSLQGTENVHVHVDHT